MNRNVCGKDHGKLENKGLKKGPVLITKGAVPSCKM